MSLRDREVVHHCSPFKIQWNLRSAKYFTHRTDQIKTEQIYRSYKCATEQNTLISVCSAQQQRFCHPLFGLRRMLFCYAHNFFQRRGCCSTPRMQNANIYIFAQFDLVCQTCEKLQGSLRYQRENKQQFCRLGMGERWPGRGTIPL